MTGLGWFAAIIVGALAGWIAEKIMHSNMGLLAIVGATLGSWIGQLIVGVIGACLLIWIARLIRGRA